MKLLVTTLILMLGCALTTRSDPPPILHLTQISSREWVDLSTVSMIRLPVYLPPQPGCPDCLLRYGADIISGGVLWNYTEEAEVTFRRILAEQK